jgi:RNA polymerase sigma-70 factor (ECF subfamily)
VTDRSDEDLVAQTLEQGPAAFAGLVERHRPNLVRLLTLLTFDADEAESLTQEAFMRALATLTEYQAGRSFRAWLRGIAVNLARNHLRDRARHARLASPEDLATAPDRQGRRQGVLSAILREELAAQTEQSIGELPALLREAFVLHYIDGMSYDDMSAATGEPAGTLRVRALRARRLLQAALGPTVDTWLREALR